MSLALNCERKVIPISDDPHFADYAELATPILPEPKPQPRNPYARLNYDRMLGLGLALLGSCVIWALVAVFVWHGRIWPQ